jgi:hypothetical protein
MATALLGPLTLGWIDYHVSSGAADQLRGGDIARLVLVGPVALPPPGGSRPADPAPTRCHSPRLRIANPQHRRVSIILGADRSRIRSASESARAVAVVLTKA